VVAGAGRERMVALDPGAPPALVLETSGGQGEAQRRGSGDGQLPNADTTFVAYAFQAAAGVAANPGTASFSGAAAGSAAFAAAGGGGYKGGPDGDRRPAAGRQRVGWSERTSSGALLRGRFSYVIETIDAAGDTSRSRRHTIRVL
jgi:hypothetical protein